ncbi:hypothetical protein L6452_28507 [Arctium lappa]|uniref:Uncharacterized protein n=1 Tax=Arctium lappa TaxID=4217 RepID=A0ACB8ZYM8_ARCLA|nr:hypothetical protein L6452_28507 [Arctium lappa]
MILHHLASGILNHKTTIFILLVKFNVWELGLKSWKGCPQKFSSLIMVLEVLGLRIQADFKRARWVKSRFSLNLARAVYGAKSCGGSSDEPDRGLVALVVTLIRGRVDTRTSGVLRW